MKNALLPCLFVLMMIPFAAMAPLENPRELPLWPKGASGSEGKAGKENVRVAEKGEHVISSIHAPSITPYLPAAGKASGARYYNRAWWRPSRTLDRSRRVQSGSLVHGTR